MAQQTVNTVATAQRLVDVLSTQYSPAQHLVAGKRAATLRQRGVDALLRETAAVREEFRPGLVRRLLLARALQRQLLDAGYDGSFVRSLMAAVMVELTRSLDSASNRP